MALDLQHFGDVTRLRMSSRGSRAVGLTVSAYIVRGIMVDTGFHAVRSALLAAVERLSVRGSIVTHWHEDHAGNAALLASRGMPVLARPETQQILCAHPHVGLYRRVIWGYPPAPTAGFAASADSSLHCVHTPGHASDHQVVWDAETGTLFSGDLWLGVRSRVLHRAEDPYQLVESLRTALALDPDRMFDAHRGPVAHPPDAIRSKIDWLGATLTAIERRVIAGDSDRAIVRGVLGGEAAAAFVSFGDYSRRNLVTAVRQHLNAAMESNLLGRSG